MNLGTILRGAVTRVFPAASLIATLLAFILSLPSVTLRSAIELAVAAIVAAGFITLGAATTLAIMRRRLRTDAGVAGRKGWMVGAAASAMLLTCLSAGPETLQLTATLPLIGMHANVFALDWADQVFVVSFALASGALGTLGVFFPWLRSRHVSEPLRSPK